jgi:peptide/nickel transport system substrate-binding protein
MLVRFGMQRVVALLLLFVLAACTPAGPSGSSGAQPGARSDAAPAINRTLVMAVKLEPVGMSTKLLVGLNNTRSARRLVNASLAINDDKGQPRPYLVEKLPEMNTNSWKILPDGRMEVTYALRPGLTWHDGTPLRIADFQFAYRMYTDPETKILFSAQPQDLMDEPVEVDERTIMIPFKTVYPDAHSLGGTHANDDFSPMPRHILEQQFLSDKGDGFANHPYWNQAYVGTGPFRIERWDPGVAIELKAFEGHAGGKAKIETIRLRWIEDPNTALANLLSGEVHLAVNDAIRFQQGSLLKERWTGNNGGTVLISARETRFIQIQFSPQFNQTKALLDVRVRRALAHALDKAAIIEGVLNGEGTPADTLMSPQMPYYQALLDAIPKYPHDLQRTEQLMGEAGFTRPPGGFYVGANGERFDPEFRAFGGGQEETELAIMVDTLRRSGIDIVSNVVPAVYSRDVQIRAAFPGLTANVTQLSERTVFNKLESFNIPLESNRWSGFNRGAWASPEFDRLEVVFNTSLDRAVRDRTVIDMMKIVNDDVGVIPLYYNLDAIAHVATLTGPTTAAPDTARDWSAPDWRWLQ